MTRKRMAGIQGIPSVRACRCGYVFAGAGETLQGGEKAHSAFLFKPTVSPEPLAGQVFNA